MSNEQTKLIANPFGEMTPRFNSNALAETEAQKGIAEIQARMAIAKRFPRDPIEATNRILNACTRISLAKTALYSYNRGKTEVTGPSIRLAETLAQNWGNFDYGIEELSQQNGSSTVKAFAWDLETNTQTVKTFQVPHIRYSKSGGNTLLTDPRDIYEKVANDGARRLRACILSTIPGDVIEAAVNQCDLTQRAKADTSPESVKQMLACFAGYKVTSEMIKKKLGNNVDAIRPAQYLQLERIYISLRDGMSKVSDWFENVQESNKSDNPLNAATSTRPDTVVDGVNQSTGEIEGDFEINPAALAGAKAEIPSGRY